MVSLCEYCSDERNSKCGNAIYLFTFPCIFYLFILLKECILYSMYINWFVDGGSLVITCSGKLFE